MERPSGRLPWGKQRTPNSLLGSVIRTWMVVGRTSRHANHILIDGDPLPVRLRRSRIVKSAQASQEFQHEAQTRYQATLPGRTGRPR